MKDVLILALDNKKTTPRFRAGCRKKIYFFFRVVLFFAVFFVVLLRDVVFRAVVFFLEAAFLFFAGMMLFSRFNNCFPMKCVNSIDFTHCHPRIHYFYFLMRECTVNVENSTSTQKYYFIMKRIEFRAPIPLQIFSGYFFESRKSNQEHLSLWLLPH